MTPDRHALFLLEHNIVSPIQKADYGCYFSPNVDDFQSNGILGQEMAAFQAQYELAGEPVREWCMLMYFK